MPEIMVAIGQEQHSAITVWECAHMAHTWVTSGTGGASSCRCQVIAIARGKGITMNNMITV